MTAETAATAVSVDALDTAIAGATGQLGEDEQRLAVAVFRLLAAGRPISIPAAAEAAALPVSRVRSVLRSWPAVFRDTRGRVTGFWGLALTGMPQASRQRSSCSLVINSRRFLA